MRSKKERSRNTSQGRQTNPLLLADFFVVFVLRKNVLFCICLRSPNVVVERSSSIRIFGDNSLRDFLLIASLRNFLFTFLCPAFVIYNPLLLLSSFSKIIPYRDSTMLCRKCDRNALNKKNVTIKASITHHRL